MSPRPFKNRIIRCKAENIYFKPQGIRGKFLQKIYLTCDEYEAIRLADLEGLSQEEAGREMDVSRQTFGRIIESARRKIADALINGKMIVITDKNAPVTLKEIHYICDNCGHEWDDFISPFIKCPECNSPVFFKRGQFRKNFRKGGI